MTNIQTMFIVSLGLFILSFIGLCKIVDYETKMRIAKIKADQKLAKHLAQSE